MRDSPAVSFAALLLGFGVAAALTSGTLTLAYLVRGLSGGGVAWGPALAVTAVALATGGGLAGLGWWGWRRHRTVTPGTPDPARSDATSTTDPAPDPRLERERIQARRTGLRQAIRARWLERAARPEGLTLDQALEAELTLQETVGLLDALVAEGRLDPVTEGGSVVYRATEERAGGAADP